MASSFQIFLASIVVVALMGIASSADDIRVRGTIFCVEDNDWKIWTPLEGQRATVYCPLFSTTSTKTDKNGFFFMELPAFRFSNECRVYLDTFGQGKKGCRYQTNVNNGITGAPIIKSNEDGIYEVAPFVYRPTPDTTLH